MLLGHANTKSILLGVLAYFFCTFTALAKEPPFSLPAPSEINKIRSAVIFTRYGEMRFELFPEEAPWHVANFKYLADKGFFVNETFNYFVPKYVIKAGEKNLDYSLPPEFNSRTHIFGSLGMARIKDVVNPERRSRASSFQIFLRKSPELDGQYTIFGELREGEEVLRKLQKGDKIQKLIVYVREEEGN